MSHIAIEKIGSGPALIMLHGWGFNANIWKSLIPLLKNHYQLFLVDLPGFGNSPLTQKIYAFDTIVPDILDQVPAVAHWLGWSLGGLFALWTGIHYPERTDKIICVASSPRFVIDSHWPGIAQETLTLFFNKLAQYPNQTLLDFLHLQLRGAPRSESILFELKNQLFEKTPNARALTHALQLLALTDLRADLPKISAETLFIFGKLDTIVPSQLMAPISSLLPRSQLELIPKTGHIPFLTHTDKISTLLRQFLG